MSISYRLASRQAVAALGFVLPFAHVTVAFAQTTGGSAPAGTGGATTTTATGSSPTVTVTTGAPTTTYFPGGVAPLPPGGTLGGGNAQYSSSKPITGTGEDTFDFRGGGSNGATMRGEANGSFTLGGGSDTTRGSYVGVPPNTHNVRRGDTLWGICGFYYQNPYQWPRIWSYNPQIQNPHWIYPGDQVRLNNGTQQGASTPSGRGAFTDRRRQVPADTVFLRNEGYIEDDQENWGEINGAREDKLFMTDYDEVYLRIGSNHDLKIGQELTVFRPIRSAGSGKVIEIQGTVKVDQWNPKERVARARVTEALDTIERGARIAPITRRFEVVPPVRNDKDIEAKVLTSVHPHNFFGQNQVLFIDKGEEDGLKPGNRFFIIRKGDAFHKTLPAGSAGQRIAIEKESPGAMETIVKPRDDDALPEEVLAELRVISTRKNTAMTLVTSSRREIEQGDHAYARKGY